MDLYQLETFVAVTRARSITRASELLHLSQPAVSAHIKALEEALGLALFERTSRGMHLTSHGERLLAKAEQTLAAHRELMAEATRLKGRLTGKLRLGAGSSSNDELVGRLVAMLAQRCPDVEVALEHGTSLQVLDGLRDGKLDAGLYHETGEPAPELATIEVAQFRIHLVAPPGLVRASEPLEWRALADVPWIYPTTSTCCGRAAESLFQAHRARPKRIISVDRGDVTRTLVARGVGVGLLHADAAREAQARGEVDLLFEYQSPVRVLFAQLASRAQEPLSTAAASAALTAALR